MYLPIQSVEIFTHQGFKSVGVKNHYNEDRFVHTAQISSVIDGATAMFPVDMNGLNPSAYTAQFLADFFSQKFDDGLSALDVLVKANEAFHTHIKDDWPEVFALKKLGPSASVCLIKRHDDGSVSYANVGDSSCFVMDKAGQSKRLSHHYQAHIDLDHTWLKACQEEIHQGTPLSQVRALPHMRTLIEGNRNQSNVTYGVFNSELETQDFMRGGLVKKDGYGSFVLFSDGLLWPDADDEHQAMDIATKKIWDHSVGDYYINQMRPLKDADADFIKYARLKHMDDATGLVVKY